MPPVEPGELLRRIELVGRVCYKSEDKIGPDTAEKFISRIIKSGHESVLEHGTFCFEIPYEEMLNHNEIIWNCLNEIKNASTGFNYSVRKHPSVLLSFNIRTLRDTCKKKPENPLVCSLITEIFKNYPILLEDLRNTATFYDYFKLRRILSYEMIETFTADELRKHYYSSVRFICDRGVSHELVRHRIAAFSQESTRYCAYGGGVTFIIPPWVDVEPGDYPTLGSLPARGAEWRWLTSMKYAEENYQCLLQDGWSPQQARSVLPNSLKTEIVMTANLREWRHVFGLRAGKAAHPQMRELMIPLSREFSLRFPAIFADIIEEEA